MAFLTQTSSVGRPMVFPAIRSPAETATYRDDVLHRGLKDAFEVADQGRDPSIAAHLAREDLFDSVALSLGACGSRISAALATGPGPGPNDAARMACVSLRSIRAWP